MSKIVLNSTYFKEEWENKEGRFNLKCEDALILNIKDVDSGETSIEILRKPEIDFYIVKEEYRSKYKFHRLYADINELEKYTVPYSRRDFHMAKLLGLEKEYKEAKKNNYFSDFKNKMLLKSPYLYQADVDIESFYKTKYVNMYPDTKVDKLKKSFFDIEVDIFNASENIDQNNTVGKINLITFFNESTNQLFAFILNEKDAKNHEDIELIKNNYNDYINKELYDDYKDNENIEIILNFYDKETDVILDFFNVVHKLKPDYCTAWNSNYDIKYIINRCKDFLNINPVYLFTHPDISKEYRKLKYIEDKERQNGMFANNGKTSGTHFSRYWDWLIAPGYTIWLDAMTCYSNLRRRNLEKSYKLDYISQLILEPVYKKRYEKEKLTKTDEEINKYLIDVNKVNLSKHGCNIRNVPYRNFSLFLKYGLRDTYLLKRMEEIEEDLNKMLFVAPFTPFEKTFKISYIIKDNLSNYLFENGKIIGNNINYDINEKINGALVASPKNIAITPEYINGIMTNVYMFIADFDASAMYPSLMRAFNICKNTVNGRILGLVEENTNRPVMRGDDLSIKLVTLDTSLFELANEGFGMKTISEYIKEII